MNQTQTILATAAAHYINSVINAANFEKQPHKFVTANDIEAVMLNHEGFVDMIRAVRELSVEGGVDPGKFVYNMEPAMADYTRDVVNKLMPRRSPTLPLKEAKQLVDWLRDNWYK